MIAQPKQLSEPLQEETLETMTLGLLTVPITRVEIVDGRVLGLIIGRNGRVGE